MTYRQLTALAALTAKHRVWLKGYGLTGEEIDKLITELSGMAADCKPPELRKTVPFATPPPRSGVTGTLDRLMNNGRTL